MIQKWLTMKFFFFFSFLLLWLCLKLQMTVENGYWCLILNLLLLFCLYCAWGWALALYVAHHDGKALAGPPPCFCFCCFRQSDVLLQPWYPDGHQQQLWLDAQRWVSRLAPWPAGVHTLNAVIHYNWRQYSPITDSRCHHLLRWELASSPLALPNQKALH